MDVCGWHDSKDTIREKRRYPPTIPKPTMIRPAPFTPALTKHGSLLFTKPSLTFRREFIESHPIETK